MTIYTGNILVAVKSGIVIGAGLGMYPTKVQKKLEKGEGRFC